jgi:hypothetical protein
MTTFELSKVELGDPNKVCKGKVPDGIQATCGTRVECRSERYCARGTGGDDVTQPGIPTCGEGPLGGTCCSCGHSGPDATPCFRRQDGVHCEHWWDGPEVCDTCAGEGEYSLADDDGDEHTYRCEDCDGGGRPNENRASPACGCRPPSVYCLGHYPQAKVVPLGPMPSVILTKEQAASIGLRSGV